MPHRKNIMLAIGYCSGMFLVASQFTSGGAETNVFPQIQQLLQENAEMRAQMKKQQELIDSLTHEMGEVRKATAEHESQQNDSKKDSTENSKSDSAFGGFNLGKVRISGEGGVGFFESGSGGADPNATFRVDEAKLFADAALWGEAYAFIELNLASRESGNVNANLGEAYVVFENVSQLWNHDNQLSLRIGRLDIPFGEEYLYRDAIDNPLISHSLSDIWGVDEGIELYGTLGNWSYVAAVQNGGVSDTTDFTADKSIAARISFDPCQRVHLSVSGFRTGALSANNDFLSAIWFGNGWFRSLGTSATTTFHDDAIEGDLTFHLPRGQIRAFGGYIHYDDNDPTQNNRRDVYYYAIEATHELTHRLYAAARFSQVFAHKGFPIVGNGPRNDYLFGPLTEEIWELNFGLGYRFNRHLVLKAEYTLEQGKLVGGAKRDHENLFATEAAFAF
jgi:hypothetical protein